MDKKELNELNALAANIRIETIRAFKKLGFGHIGGTMSIAEVLALLYGKVMKIDPKNPKWVDRDRLVLSKGHAGPSLYAALALKGYFPVEELSTLNTVGTNLPSHCDMNKTVGIDMTTGSLGQGISAAIGMALGNKLDKRDSYTYLIVGDGECNEGQIWEGVMFAAHHKLDNLITFIDYNKKQLDGYIIDINDIVDIGSKFEAFGWHNQEVDGTDIEAINQAIEKAKEVKDKPSVIVLDTIKGHGASFAENVELNHHMVITPDMADEAISVLEKELEKYN